MPTKSFLVTASSFLKEILLSQVNSNKYYDGRSKSSKLHQERRNTAEHFCCDSTQPLLIKLEKTHSDFLF